jgi:hypothetical protein
VPTEDRLNVLLIGPPNTGKSTSAKLLVEDGRRILSIDEVIEWAMSSPPSLQDSQDAQVREKLFEVITKFDEHHEKLEAEREEEAKKKKMSFHKVPPASYPLDIDDIAYLIRRRSEQPDCNCGVIFDGCASRFLQKGNDIESIMTGLKAEKTAVLVPALAGRFGFTLEEKVSLGNAFGTVAALVSKGPEIDEQVAEFAETLKMHYTELREILVAKNEAAQESLKKAKDARDAAMNKVDAAIEGDEHGDQDAAAKVVVKEFETQVKEIESQLESYKAALASLDHALEDSQSSQRIKQIIVDMVECIGEVERVAAKILALSKSEDVKHRTKSPRKIKDMTFEPPERQDDTQNVVDAREDDVGASPVKAQSALDTQDLFMYLLPLPLDDVASPLTDPDSVPLQKLQAGVKGAVPLPLIPTEKPLPPPTFVQLVNQPQSRQPVNVQTNFVNTNFVILTPHPGTAGEHSELGTGAEMSEMGSRRPSKENKGSKGVGDLAGKRHSSSVGSKGSKVASDDISDANAEQTRWIIEPHGNQRLLLKFSAQKIDTFPANLAFEVVGGVHGNAPMSISAIGTTAYPSINKDPRNVFMRRIKQMPPSGYASKQFVVQKDKPGYYDFGPLLVGRSPDSRNPSTAAEGQTSALDNYVRQHIESFRITNNSLFKAHVDFELNSVIEARRDASGDAKSFDEAYPFIVEPKSLDLEIDETQEISVSCFPQREDTYKDKVVATVQHNPERIEFSLCALGSLPKVNVESSELDFGRLLLKQRATDYIKFSNVCALPVRWRLNPGEAGVPDHFDIECKEGILQVNEQRSIAVTFRAEESQAHSFSLTLQIGDNENFKPLEDNKQIQVRAEAFSVDVVPLGCQFNQSFTAFGIGPFVI